MKLVSVTTGMNTFILAATSIIISLTQSAANYSFAKQQQYPYDVYFGGKAKFYLQGMLYIHCMCLGVYIPKAARNFIRKPQSGLHSMYHV